MIIKSCDLGIICIYKRPLNTAIIALGCFIVTNMAIKAQDTHQYLGQTPPGIKPTIFAPGIISLDSLYEFGSVFTADGLEFFYGVNIGPRPEIRFTRYTNGVWQEPITIISDPTYGLNDPFLSPAEDELYYISNRPQHASDDTDDHNIWYSKKTENGWSEPIDPGPSINSNSSEYYISFTDEGTMYFASNTDEMDDGFNDFDIFSSRRISGEYQPDTRLSSAINTEDYEADVFVAYDESYLIFCGIRKEGLGQGDLYISFKDENGDWKQAVNMGDQINTSGHELCPFVTKDGQYFFYTSRKDIYWVSTEIFNQFRK